MNTDVLLGSADKVKDLAKKLSSSSAVAKSDSSDEPQAWTLAVSFNDLERSFRRFLDEQLKKLVHQHLSPQELEDVLFEIGEEFRHILYHLQNTAFYHYLLENPR